MSLNLVYHGKGKIEIPDHEVIVQYKAFGDGLSQRKSSDLLLQRKAFTYGCTPGPSELVHAVFEDI